MQSDTQIQEMLMADPDIREWVAERREIATLRRQNRMLYCLVVLLFFGLVAVGGKLLVP